MIEVGALRALRSVAALGTLARAADELGFTASAVSQQIKRLERQVGVPVLAPAGRGVVLTPAGRAIVDSAPEVFQALERCAEAAQSVAEGAPRGTLRVVAFSTAIRGLLAPAIPGLSARCPELRVEIVEQDPDEALHSVDAGTADLALAHDADGLPVPLPASLNRCLLHTDVGDVVMPRTHPLARLDRPLGNADLIGHRWVTSPPGTVCHQWFRRLFADVPEDPDVRHWVDDFSTQLALVAAGEVLALIPRLARPPLREGLVPRPLRRPPQREVHAVWRSSADASPAIRTVLAELGAG
ncbi:DNA-binding transcriptional regulator, LysR family [Saccharopolyspora kobensis]|uniref:DNA-binding transcriptional regulator, LysR family n=1 Tax=Saccharopolyspora kobensis TaxID=146035 RepID=A0A1H6DZ76_9PSEU|nr:LysR family transcriptional regulator [Saccharopolyspora kobensis]SEG90638.1 DNA-binding transcriptional regulator, LysR family [Saccharopolyspora kobensis]SFD92823.1 DNA-binding transcriptional regulator, LysR family [Saccharopolyspora kobensis]